MTLLPAAPRHRRSSAALFVLALGALGATGCGSARLHLAAATPGIALDPRLDKDIHDGVAAYGNLLTRWGRWEEDEWYAVRWCPNPDQIASNGGAQFSPYRTRGHWTTNESQAAYGASPGSPYWMSDDGDTWGDITMHHGWWVHLADSPTHAWCWIPGVEATAGRVVWRSGEGFVGWAPESPTWVDDGGDDAISALDWSFAFLGSLLELDLGAQILEGDARGDAADATMSVRALEGSPRVARVGPPSISVHTARAALVAYAAEHGGSRPPRPETEAPKRASGATGTSSVDSSPTKKKKDEERLPPSAGIYERMSADPGGPSGMGPRYAPSRVPSSFTGSSSTPSASRASSGSPSSPSSSSHTSSAPSSATSSSSSHSAARHH